MRKLGLALAALVAVSVMSFSRAEAQGQAPWPPPPGMTAGEYAARYGHRIDPNDGYAQPRRRGDWDRDRAYRRSDRQRWRERSYYDDD